MKFTKGHFEAVAAKFRRSLEWVENGHPDQFSAGYKVAVIDIAQVFERSNEKFDRDKFFKACGIDNPDT